MKDCNKVIEIIIQKKFREILDANREKKLYDFKGELKKELETTLSEMKDPNEKKEVEKLLWEINNQQIDKGWVN